MTKTSNQSSLADAITNSQHLYEVRLRKGLKKGRADRAGAQRTVADISRKSDKQGDFDFGATNRAGPSRQCPGLARSEGCNAPCFRPATKQLIEVPDHKTRLAAVTLELAYTEGRPIERQMSLSGKFEDLAALQERFDIRPGTFTAAFPGRAFGKRDLRATGPRLDRVLKVPA